MTGLFIDSKSFTRQKPKDNLSDRKNMTKYIQEIYKINTRKIYDLHNLYKKRYISNEKNQPQKTDCFQRFKITSVMIKKMTNSL